MSKSKEADEELASVREEARLLAAPYDDAYKKGVVSFHTMQLAMQALELVRGR